MNTGQLPRRLKPHGPAFKQDVGDCRCKRDRRDSSPLGLEFDSSGITIKVKDYQDYDRVNSPGQLPIVAYEDRSPDVLRDAYKLTSR